MDGRQRFRSSAFFVKTALRFLIKSDEKNLEFNYQKRKSVIWKNKS
jgi:hypothetical protein